MTPRIAVSYSLSLRLDACKTISFCRVSGGAEKARLAWDSGGSRRHPFDAGGLSASWGG